MSKVCLNCASYGAAVCSCQPDAKDRRIAELERRVETLTAARMNDIEAFVKLHDALTCIGFYSLDDNSNIAMEMRSLARQALEEKGDGKHDV